MPLGPGMVSGTMVPRPQSTRGDRAEGPKRRLRCPGGGSIFRTERRSQVWRKTLWGSRGRGEQTDGGKAPVRVTNVMREAAAGGDRVKPLRPLEPCPRPAQHPCHIGTYRARVLRRQGFPRRPARNIPAPTDPPTGKTNECDLAKSRDVGRSWGASLCNWAAAGAQEGSGL
ncbi:hypothetical protein VTI74DRAFT_1479 [Chaetomium olivicolor]